VQDKRLIACQITPINANIPVPIVARAAGDALKKFRKRMGNATLRALKDKVEGHEKLEQR
jgi:hypothetical protein